MKYFVNIVTGALVMDIIKPPYPMYWREISREEYEKLLEQL